MLQSSSWTLIYAIRTGGFTFCAIASFHLAGRLPDLPNRHLHLRWLVNRQIKPPVQVDSDTDSDELHADPKLNGLAGPPSELATLNVAGFQGRSGKDTDACYSFWCTAALKVRNGHLGAPIAVIEMHFLI